MDVRILDVLIYDICGWRDVCLLFISFWFMRVYVRHSYFRNPHTPVASTSVNLGISRSYQFKTFTSFSKKLSNKSVELRIFKNEGCLLLLLLLLYL